MLLQEFPLHFFPDWSRRHRGQRVRLGINVFQTRRGIDVTGLQLKHFRRVTARIGRSRKGHARRKQYQNHRARAAL
jgi:hypothetical protein